jgi:hypothetical protein
MLPSAKGEGHDKAEQRDPYPACRWRHSAQPRRVALEQPADPGQLGNADTALRTLPIITHRTQVVPALQTRQVLVDPPACVVVDKR